MKRWLPIALIAAVSLGAVVRAEMSPEKQQEIQKMLRITGVEKLMGQAILQMLNQLKANSPRVPEAFWEKMQQQIDTHELMDKLIPLYDKYYTLDDLKAVNAFYESPVGQKILRTMPQIMQESMKIGQAWGERWGRQAAAEAEMEMGQAQPPQIFELELVDYGIYTGAVQKVMADPEGPSGNVRIAQAELLSKTDTVPAQLNTKFGFKYVLKGEPREALVPLRVVFDYPAMTNPVSGKISSSCEYRRKAQLGPDVSGVFWDFTNPWEIHAGEWTISIYSGTHLLTKKTFTVKDTRK